MRIAISSSGPDLDAEVDPRFGRCQYFIFVDPETLEFEAIANSNIGASGGAGISSAQMVASKEVEAVLTGNCGPNAYQTLSAAGIHIITGVTGTVRGAVDLYRNDQWQAATEPSVSAHHGTGAIRKETKPGRSMGPRTSPEGEAEPAVESPGSPATGPKQEIQSLKNHTAAMRQQLSDIESRIDRLSKKGG
jgi:predicted Fe-Mo cluster-binding NifX family protein